MDNIYLKSIDRLLNSYSAEAIEKVCEPLELLNIHHFHFMRIFNDGKLISIAKNKTWIEHFYKYKLYHHSYFNRSSTHLLNGAVFWLDVNESSLILKERLLFDVTNNGVSIIINNANICSLYHFATHDPTHIYDIYKNKIALLYRFINYFHEKFHSAIYNMQTNSIGLDFSTVENVNKISNEAIEKFKSKTTCKRFYIEEQECYLTRQELVIIKQYAQGKSCAEIADVNNLSHKTVQTHINNVKSKLNCNKTSKLINILQKYDPILSQVA